MSELEDNAGHIHFYSDDIPELIVKHMEASDWNTLLDVGCGDGCLIRALHRNGLLEGKEVWAVDLSPTRVERLEGLGLGIRCIVEDATDMKSIGDASVDFLVTTQVIEHVSDDRRMVQELSRVLGDGCVFYLNTVFKRWYAWYYHRCNGKWVIEPTHLREYTRESQLLDILKAYGLEVLESRKIPAWYSILDFILHRAGGSSLAYENKALAFLRRIKVPIPGYYNWEIVGIKSR